MPIYTPIAMPAQTFNTTYLRQGRVVLNGVRFFCDPSVYRPFDIQGRGSKFLCVGGKQVIQDFGGFIGDSTLQLASNGNQNVLDVDAVQTFLQMRLSSTFGKVYQFFDWLGNDFTVFMSSFKPAPLLNNPDTFWYEYSMTLEITQVNTLLGGAGLGVTGNGVPLPGYTALVVDPNTNLTIYLGDTSSSPAPTSQYVFQIGTVTTGSRPVWAPQFCDQATGVSAISIANAIQGAWPPTNEVLLYSNLSDPLLLIHDASTIQAQIDAGGTIIGHSAGGEVVLATLGANFEPYVTEALNLVNGTHI